MWKKKEKKSVGIKFDIFDYNWDGRMWKRGADEGGNQSGYSGIRGSVSTERKKLNYHSLQMLLQHQRRIRMSVSFLRDLKKRQTNISIGLVLWRISSRIRRTLRWLSSEIFRMGCLMQE